MALFIRASLLAFLVLFPVSLFAQSKPFYNSIRVELPSDGGGMLMYSKMWHHGRHIQYGFDVGGGVIERDFDVTFPTGIKKEAETKALVLPYIGTAGHLFLSLYWVERWLWRLLRQG